MSYAETMLALTPELRERQVGGWLAVSPEVRSIPLAVQGSTQDEALGRFCAAAREWAALMDRDVTAPV